MKKSLFNFSISLISTLLLGIIISLILAILKNNNWISGNAINICTTSLSIIAFFIFGFIFSFKQKKGGLLNSLLLTIIYLIVYFITKSLNDVSTPVYLVISRIVAIILGSIFGVNLSSKSGQTN